MNPEKISIYPETAENKETGEAGFARRDVLKIIGKAGAGLALAKISYDSGLPDFIIEKYNEFMNDGSDSGRKELNQTKHHDEIEKEDWISLEEIINYDHPGRIEFADTLEEKVAAYWKERYSKDSKLSRSLSYAYSEMGRWQNHVKKEFVEAGFSEKDAGDLLMLAIPESHMVYYASSSAGAAGIYQFIPETGRKFGLEQKFTTDQNGKPKTLIIDERLDPVRSGGAAAKCLKSLLKNSNDDMKLALSGYNGGYCWKYFEHAKKIGEQPSYDGFLRFMEDRINILRDGIRSAEHGTYKIKRGDSFGKVAERFSIDAEILSQANNGLDDNDMRPGQEIKIPYINDDVRRKDFIRIAKDYKENLNYPGKLYAILELIRENPEKFNKSTQRPQLKIDEKPLDVSQPPTTHIYNKKADTYGLIAKKYNISITALYAANREIDPKKIKDGIPLKLPTTPISLDIIARSLGRKLEDLKLLNPHILNTRYPLPNGYKVRI